MLLVLCVYVTTIKILEVNDNSRTELCDDLACCLMCEQPNKQVTSHIVMYRIKSDQTGLAQDPGIAWRI